MDKKLKRVIGYTGIAVKSEAQKLIVKKETAKVETKKEEPILVKPDLDVLVKIQKDKSAKIIKWITDHEEFKWGIMCTKLEVDRGNFQRLLKNKDSLIKADLIPKIETFLKQYGYAE